MTGKARMRRRNDEVHGGVDRQGWRSAERRRRRDAPAKDKAMPGRAGERVWSMRALTEHALPEYGPERGHALQEFTEVPVGALGEPVLAVGVLGQEKHADQPVIDEVGEP